MALRDTPPFRADHVGSLLRPPELLDARAKHEAGEIGDITHYRGVFLADYANRPDAAASWRFLRADAGSGALGDLMARFDNVTYQLMLECGGNGRSFFTPEARGNQWTNGGARCPQWTGVRLADVQLAFPVIMLAIAIVAVVGTTPAALVSVLALSGWVLYARTVRASVLTIRQLEYVEAARALGASGGRLIARHILPNTLAPILVIGSSQFATMVLLESALIAIVGGGLGLALSYTFITYSGDPTGGLLPAFYFPTPAIVTGLGLVLALGLAAGFLPAWQASRLRIVDALR